MPLSRHRRKVSGIFQDFRNRDVIRIGTETGISFRPGRMTAVHVSQSCLMRIKSRQQIGTRRATACTVIHLRHTDAILCQFIQHRCMNLTTEAAEIGEAQIVCQYDIILADDLGFSDLGCFGGEIHTPVLDKLAKNGVRMTQMYNSARSCPSRANLLTGLYPHQTGLGHMDGSHPAWPKGYSGFRSNSDNVTIAEVLKDAGYFTAMSGKWHLGNKSNPILRGFQEYYGLLGGFNSFWNPAAIRWLLYLLYRLLL